MGMGQMEHRTSKLEKVLKASPEKVFDAWADTQKRSKWNSPSEEVKIVMEEADFSEGGRDVSVCVVGEMPVAHVIGTYHEIVPNKRIVFTEAISSEGVKVGASLVSVAFEPEGTGTRLLVVLQTVAVDGSTLLDEVVVGWEAALSILQGMLD